MSNHFWKWDKAIPKDVCEIIKSQFVDDQSKIGQVNNGQINPETRNSNICWLHTNHWVEGILFNHVRYANKYAQWNFDVRGIEQIQVSKYKQGQFYEWHTDTDIDSKKDAARKLSVVLLLSDPSEYQGGGLFMKAFDNNLLENQGDLIVFPSYLLHKAGEVTDGCRMTAVGWATGPAFK